jgi:hypothetical protein
MDLFDKGKNGQYRIVTGVAITTFGMNNHGVKADRFRYIRYEDGGEELYDTTSGP